MKDNVKKLKNLLYLARKKMGLSQADLARQMEVTRQYINNLESSSVASKEGALIDALAALGIEVIVDLDELIQNYK